MRTMSFIQFPFSISGFARGGGNFGESRLYPSRGMLAQATVNLPEQNLNPSPAVSTPGKPEPPGRPEDKLSQLAGTGNSPATLPAEAGKEKLDYKVPFGESGVGDVDDVNRHNALLRLFAFEGQHAAAQRGKTVKAGEAPAQVDIRIKTAVDEDGYPIPAGGATESWSDTDGDGLREVVMRELAVLSQTRRLLISAGTSLFGMDSRPMPVIKHAGTLASGYRVMQNRRELRQLANRPDGFDLLNQLNPRHLDTILKAFAPIEEALAKLQDTLSGLCKDSALATVSASGGGDVLTPAINSRSAQEGEYTVTVKQIAQAHKVESGFYYPDDEALGLDGSFTLNGVAVTVAATDTIWDIAESITYGEDLNHNGKLDTDSDFFTEEDADLDGELDGGAVNHGVKARVWKGRLQLESAVTGPDPIQVTDADGILEELGLVEEGDNGVLQFVNEVTAPAAAVITVDEETSSYGSNVVTTAIPGVDLKLKAASEEPVTVAVVADGDSLAAELDGLIRDFNAAMQALNQALNPHTGVLYNSDSTARVRINLRNSSIAPIPGQPEEFSFAEDAGVVPQPGTRLAFFSAQLDTALAGLKNTLKNPAGDSRPTQKQTGMPSVYNSLNLIGITSEANDTLALDRDKLLSAVGENLEAVRNLFGKEEGWVPRLAEAVANANNRDRGLIASAKEQVKALMGIQGKEMLTQNLTAAQSLSLLNTMKAAIPPQDN